MNLFGNKCGDDGSNIWIWIIIIVVLVLLCCDGNLFGGKDNDDCCRDKRCDKCCKKDPCCDKSCKPQKRDDC